MDIESPALDLLDEVFPELAEAPPEAPASAEGASESDEALDVQPEAAVADALPSDPEPDNPVPDYASQLDAMKAQMEAIQAKADAAAEKAEQFDRLKQMAEEQAAQRAEQEKFAAWQKRMDDLEDLPASQRDAEKQRILGEVRQYRDEQYQQDIAVRDSAAEDAAKAFAAWYTVAKQSLPTDQFTALEADAKHLLQFSSPDAMQSQIARDRALEKRGYERALAELAKKREAGLAKQAQERIASGADLVGAGVGAPAKGDDDWSTDKFLDSLFG